MSKTTYALNYAFGHIAEIEQAVQELQTKNTKDQSFYVYVDLTKNPARMAVTTRPIDDPWFVLVYAGTTETFTVKGEKRPSRSLDQPNHRRRSHPVCT